MEGMNDPYRSPRPLAAPGSRVRLPEPEPAPLRLAIGARQYSDGSSELRFGGHSHLVAVLSLSLLGIFLLVMAIYEVVECFGPGPRSGEAVTAVFFAVGGMIFARMGLGGVFGGERIVISPGSVSVISFVEGQAPAVLMVNSTSEPLSGLRGP